MSEPIANQIHARGNELFFGLIIAGRLTTKEYREFCSKHNVSPEQGVSLPYRPHPFPLRDPVKCDQCEIVFERWEVEDYMEIVMPEEFGHPDDAEPAEYEQVCPECGARESISDDDVKCDRCDEYPCCCEITT